ncbi:MAG: V-type ATP synthase subunit K [Bacillota bacterium]|nr:V-type ATP synthase subunit K [Bacillota bacterium]
MEWKEIFNGQFWAMFGAALAAGFGGLGSAKGVSIAGEAGAGVLTEDSNKFVPTLLLQALPGTQGIYGLLVAFIILNKIGVFAGSVSLTLNQGFLYFVAALPAAMVEFYSAIMQGRASVASMGVIAKRPEDIAKAMLYPAMVETYAVLALLISILMVLYIK